MNDENLGRLIIVIANPCTQFVAEHVHSPAVERFIAQEVIEAGGVAWDCSTITVDDDIAMGQDSALQPSVVRPHRRVGGICGQCPLRGCAGARFQLRSDGCAEITFGGERPFGSRIAVITNNGLCLGSESL
jgi:hypothetical protein